MSRKAREDQSTWKMQSVHAFVGEYGPFRTKGYNPIENSVVWLCNTQSNNEKKNKEKKLSSTNDHDRRHHMYSLASSAQEILVRNNLCDSNNNKNNSVHRITTIIIIDVKDMFENNEQYETAVSQEIEEVELTKLFGKKIIRLFQRLLLKNVIVAAEAILCEVLLKLYQSIQAFDPDMINEIWLFHPNISSKFINMHLTQPSQSRQSKGPVKKISSKN